MLEIFGQLGLGFAIGFSGAAIPGPLTTFIIANGLSGANRFNGILSALGHCVVEACIIALIVVGLVTVFDAAPLRILNIAGGGALVFFGALGLLSGDKNHEEKTGITKNAFVGGAALSILNGTIPLWWGTIGLPQLGYAMKSAALTGAVLWVAGHWSADLAWYGFLGYFTYQGRRRLGRKMVKRITVACSLVAVLIGGLFIYLALSL